MHLALRMTIWQDDKGIPSIIGLPDDLVAKYYTHTMFGAEFRSWYDLLVGEFGSLKDFSSAKSTGQKRATAGDGTNPPKKLKPAVDVKRVAPADMSGVETHSVTGLHIFACEVVVLPVGVTIGSGGSAEPEGAHSC